MNIEYSLYYERYCSAVGALSLLYFFIKKVLLGALSFLFSISKVCGSGLVTRLKSLSTGARSSLAGMRNALYIFCGHRLFCTIVWTTL